LEESILGGNTLLQGIHVTVIGMGLVFFSLGILLLAMIALERLFRPDSFSSPGVVAPLPKGVSKGEEEKVAAIAVAIASVLAEGAGVGSTERTEVRVEEAELGVGLREKTSPWALLDRGGWIR
jgi:Na+-transporting methylmalonyl-CoA/oxaloacetate decarboxylase gamma subunit